MREIRFKYGIIWKYDINKNRIKIVSPRGKKWHIRLWNLLANRKEDEYNKTANNVWDGYDPVPNIPISAITSDKIKSYIEEILL